MLNAAITVKVVKVVRIGSLALADAHVVLQAYQ
jgi:hypothetical protein